MSDTVETIAGAAEFAALGREWDALVRAVPRPSPFLLHGWLAAWWEHHAAGATLSVHVARRDGRLVAALPLYVRRRHGVRIARFLGDDAAALADLLTAPEAEPSTPATLLDRALAGADFADLFGLPAHSRLAAAAGAGHLTLLMRADAPVLDLDGGWDAVYRAKTSAKRRSLHRRRLRQLGETGPVSVEVARDPDTLAAALEEAFRLHAARWRDRPEASGFASATGRGFHRAAVRALAPLGVPRIVLVRAGGRPVACNYFLLLEHRMYFHELAFDPAFARVSPGVLATLAAIEAAADEGARRVEFLGGAERYKLELADRFEPLYQGIGLAVTARGRVASTYRETAIRARRVLKRTPVRDLYYDGLAPVRRVARTVSSSISARPGTSAEGRSPTRTP
jgi:CelD/BcsL family acetyltransferase involved in cellulose biosynthesis